MSRTERDKGVRGELEVRDICRAHGFDCDRVPNSGGLRIKGDLYGGLPLHVEVKRQEVWRLPVGIAQAEADANDHPWLLAFRRSRSPWYAALPLANVLERL